MLRCWTLCVVVGWLGCSPAPPKEPVPLTVLAINDFHGALREQLDRDDPELAHGGLPWLAGTLDAIRAETPHTLLFDGGDVFQGDWSVNATRGRGAVEAFNLLNVDAGAVGNHEFDYGGGQADEHPLRGALETAAKQAQWHWLSANVEEIPANGSPVPWAPEGIKATAMIDKHGVRVGVIGLTTTDTPQTTLARNVADLRFNDPVETVRTHAARLRSDGASVIAVVGHLTGKCPKGTAPTTPCTPDGEIGRLLTELPAGTIDIIASGHSHTTMAFQHEQTTVLQNSARGRRIGRVDLMVGSNGPVAELTQIHPPLAISHPRSDPGCENKPRDDRPATIGPYTVTPSKPAIALIERLQAEAGSLCTPAGCTHRVLGRSRNAQSEVGDVVVDAMWSAFPKADLAMTNSGGLRADLPAGPLRREHLQAVMPFDNRILLIEMTGEKIIQLFEIGTSGAHGIMQVAGAHLHVDPTRTAATDINGDGQTEEWERQRLCSMQIGNVDVDPTKRYRIVTSDFLFSGGDHLGPAFANATVLQEGPLIREHLMSWFTTHEGCVDAPSDRPVRISQGPCVTP